MIAESVTGQRGLRLSMDPEQHKSGRKKLGSLCGDYFLAQGARARLAGLSNMSSSQTKNLSGIIVHRCEI